MNFQDCLYNSLEREVIQPRHTYVPEHSGTYSAFESVYYLFGSFIGLVQITAEEFENGGFTGSENASNVIHPLYGGGI